MDNGNQSLKLFFSAKKIINIKPREMAFHWKSTAGNSIWAIRVERI